MNNVIETIFKNFKVNNKSIPVSFMKYEGKETTFITYQSISNSPSFSMDDEIKISVEHIDIDIYSQGNYLEIMKQVKLIMKNNGFTWVEDSTDMYEEDTKFYHKTIEFCIERKV